ncbi:unnamed protein product, partial [Brugia timori]
MMLSKIRAEEAKDHTSKTSYITILNSFSSLLAMSASINAENEAADQENVVASERDTSPPPAKVTRTDRKESISHPRKHLETVLSQRSEGSD